MLQSGDFFRAIVPYFPADLMKNAQKRIYGFEGVSSEDIKAIRHGNALKLFPTILERIRGKFNGESPETMFFKKNKHANFIFTENS